LNQFSIVRLAMNSSSSTPLRIQIWLVLLAVCAVVGRIEAQSPGIPEPPLVLLGTVTDASTNQPVAITTVSWQVSDGGVNQNYSAASLPATRVVSTGGQSFYVLQVPFDSRIVQDGASQIALSPAAGSFELKSTSPTYSLTAVINGQVATIKAVNNVTQTPGTPAYAFNDYTPPTQGRMVQVDLLINQDPYLTWALQYFGDPNAAKTADPDGDGQTNEQEFIAGTDPTNGNSALRLTNFSRATDGTSFFLTWQSIPGKSYQVQTTTDFSTWTDVGTPMTASATLTSTDVTIPGNPARVFYRVKIVP